MFAWLKKLLGIRSKPKTYTFSNARIFIGGEEVALHGEVFVIALVEDTSFCACTHQVESHSSVVGVETVWERKDGVLVPVSEEPVIHWHGCIECKECDGFWRKD